RTAGRVRDAFLAGVVGAGAARIRQRRVDVVVGARVAVVVGVVVARRATDARALLARIGRIAASGIRQRRIDVVIDAAVAVVVDAVVADRRALFVVVGQARAA